MATQMQLARQGIITEAMQIVAKQEQVTPEFIREGVANGTILAPPQAILTLSRSCRSWPPQLKLELML